MELAIAGATTVAVVLWIVSGALAYKQRENGFIWTIFFAIIFSILPFFLTWQKRSWEQPKAADASASTKDLPFIHVPVLSFVNLDEGKTPCIRGVIRNGGGSPAKCIVGADNWRLTQSTTAYDGPFKPSSGPSYSALLGIGDDAVGITTINPPLNDSQIRDIKQRVQFFYYYLDIEYDDLMGNHYLTRTCNVYNPLTNHFDVCEVRNDNQQQKERKYPCPKAN